MERKLDAGLVLCQVTYQVSAEGCSVFQETLFLHCYWLDLKPITPSLPPSLAVVVIVLQEKRDQRSRRKGKYC